MNIDEILLKQLKPLTVCDDNLILTVKDAKQAIREIIQGVLEMAAEDAKTKKQYEPIILQDIIVVDKQSITNVINKIKI